ncbi:hypothetical protein BIT28_06375 [Photobacterium proteolyticum]|uniref:Uncharacterized protein n=1 Tax=Photobacterium proteolyticum TaxID=1903952 RepID=A0A1Q9GEI9_9GAMM|nr:hypothetical protein [Photobacterium proteolyticum]OLQ72810.1 hypothetical protein BIT28_06375 [Photobacterium proteolyticum]
MKKQFVMAVLSAAILSGCAVKEVCPPSTRVNIPVSEVPGNSSDKYSAIILPAEVEFDDKAAVRISKKLTSLIENEVSKTGTKVVDRSLAKKLKDEIRLAESTGKYNSHKVPVADFAIITDVNGANFNHSFKEAYTWVDDEGKKHYVPASCRYSAEVTGITKIVSMPSMETLARIELDGDDSQSRDTRNSNCPYTKEDYNSMLTVAAKNALTRADQKIKNALAPVGVVMEMRSCDTADMVKVSIGSKRNVEPKQTVLLTSREKVDDGDGNIEIETRQYGDGYVVDNKNDAIKAKYSWVVIDKEIAKQVQKGDTAKTDFNGICDGNDFTEYLCNTATETADKIF